MNNALHRLAQVGAAFVLVLLIHLLALCLLVLGIGGGLARGFEKAWPEVKSSWGRLWGVMRNGR